MRFCSYHGPAFFFVSFVFFHSCNTNPGIQPHALHGRWELQEGFRNQKATETLSGTYFFFEEGNKMKTNLPVGPEMLVPFELESQTIRQKTSPEIKYKILQITDSSLFLGLELRGMQFEFRLRKTKEEETVPSALPTSPESEAPVDSTLK